MLSLTMTMKEAESTLAQKEFNDTLLATKKAMVTYTSLSASDRLNNTDQLRHIIELRCDAHSGLGELQDALDDAAELCRQFSDNADSFYRLGDLARRVRHFKVAKAYLEHALMLNENLTRAKVLLKSIQTDIEIGSPIPPKFQSIHIQNIAAFERGEKSPEAVERDLAAAAAQSIKQSILPNNNNNTAAAAAASTKPKTEKTPEPEEVKVDEKEETETDSEEEEEEVRRPGWKKHSGKPFLTKADAPHWVIYPLMVIIFLCCFLNLQTFIATFFCYYCHYYLEMKPKVDIFRINGIPLSVFTAAIMCGSFFEIPYLQALNPW